MRELQVEDPLHEHLSVAVEIQGVRVADDLIVRVRVQQHSHVAASGPHLDITEADVKIAREVCELVFMQITFFFFLYIKKKNLNFYALYLENLIGK